MPRVSRALFLVLTVVLTACGDTDDGGLPRDAAALLELYRTHGEAGRLDEAGRALQALTDLADHGGARATEIEAMAAAWDERLRDGARLGETAWVTQALGVLDRAARRPAATQAVEVLRLDALVVAAAYAWDHDDPDSAARLLHDIEEALESASTDAQSRALRARAWGDAFQAGLATQDESLTARALERLDQLARADGATAAERRTYLDMLEVGQRHVLAQDLVDEAAALRARAAEIADRPGATSDDRVALVRMLGVAAVHDALGERDRALGWLDEATRRLDGLDAAGPDKDDARAWLDAQRFLVHRARRDTSAARDVLHRLEGGVAAPDARPAQLEALATAWAASVRDVAEPGQRAHLLEALELLARRPEAGERVLVDLGRALVGAAERARADGHGEEAADYLAKLRGGAEGARDPQVRARLAELLAAAEAGANVAASDVPR